MQRVGKAHRGRRLGRPRIDMSKVPSLHPERRDRAHLGVDQVALEAPAPGRLRLGQNRMEGGVVQVDATKAKKVIKSAVLSPDGKYRYSLGRDWRGGRPGRKVVWIMLNPSTADAEVDDPTIRRCAGFSIQWGMSRMVVINQFALRATDPRELHKVSEAEARGPDNLTSWRLNLRSASLVVAAWGAFPVQHDHIDPRKIMERKMPIYCLGHTAAGLPKHPLYLPSETPLERFFRS